MLSMKHTKEEHYTLGIKYSSNANFSPLQAVIHLQKAVGMGMETAKSSLNMAYCQLGRSYLEGINGVAKNEEKGISWLTKSVEGADGINSQLQLAYHYYDKAIECENNNIPFAEHFHQSLKWFQSASNFYDSSEEYKQKIQIINCKLGEYYFHKKDATSEELQQAFTHFKNALPYMGKAHYFLGLCYLKGKGVTSNFKTALRYFQTLTKESPYYQNTHYELALYYENSGNKNHDKAMEHYKLAGKEADYDRMRNIIASQNDASKKLSQPILPKIDVPKKPPQPKLPQNLKSKAERQKNHIERMESLKKLKAQHEKEDEEKSRALEEYLKARENELLAKIRGKYHNRSAESNSNTTKNQHETSLSQTATERKTNPSSTQMIDLSITTTKEISIKETTILSLRSIMASEPINLFFITPNIANNIQAAAAQGDMEAQYLLGFEYFRQSFHLTNGYLSILEAIRFWNLACEQHCTAAMYNLAALYTLLAESDSNPEYLQKSLQLLQLAAQLEYADAQYELGCLYLTGNAIVKPDYSKSMGHSIKAAASGKKEAHNTIGILYSCGLIVPVNLEMAKLHFSLAKTIPMVQENLQRLTENTEHLYEIDPSKSALEKRLSTRLSEMRNQFSLWQKPTICEMTISAETKTTQSLNLRLTAAPIG